MAVPVFGGLRISQYWTEHSGMCYTDDMARTKEFDPEKVIGKALDLFRLRGYEATSVDDLVTHLGIRRSSLYDTFGSKHALYLAALDRYLEKSQPLSAGGEAGFSSARKIIEDILTLQVEEALSLAPCGGCFLVNSIAERMPQDQDVTRRVRENLAQSESMFVRLLKSDSSLGLDEAESQRLAQYFVNTVLGIRLMAKANPDRQSLLNVASTALRALG